MICCRRRRDAPQQQPREQAFGTGRVGQRTYAPSLYDAASPTERLTFAWISDLVARGYATQLEEGDLPDLVVIDGGEAQLAKALEARAEAGAWEVAMVGLAKARAERKVRGKQKEASEERVWMPGALAPIEAFVASARANASAR